jgi:hypothetical protein
VFLYYTIICCKQVSSIRAESVGIYTIREGTRSVAPCYRRVTRFERPPRVHTETGLGDVLQFPADCALTRDGSHRGASDNVSQFNFGSNRESRRTG